MTKQIFVLLMLVSVALTTYAYAETSTVEVPFDFHGQSCYFDEIAVEYHCTWQGIVQERMTIEELESFKDGINDRLIDDAIAELEAEALEEIAIEQAILTPNEKLIQSLQAKYDRGEASKDDIVLLRMLEQLDMCYQGLGRSAPIQGEREFEISLSKDWKFNSVGYDNKIGQLVRAIEECRGQYIMETQTLSAYYDNIVSGENDITYDHRAYFGEIQALPFDKFRATSTDIDRSAICENNQFSIEHRQQFGCYVQGYLTNEQVNAENKINGYYNESGMITFQSDVFDRFNAYLLENGSRDVTTEDLDKVAEEAGIIVEELLSSNPWYNRD
jgi:hypothetical protein